MPIPSPIPALRTTTSCDADDHAHNLTAWEQQYNQMTPGRFQGTLVEMHLPHMQVFSERTSCALVQSCCVWPDAIWFGLPADPGPAQADRINGRLAGQDPVLLRPGSQEFQLMTPASYHIYGVVVQQQALREAAEAMSCRMDWAHLCRAELLQVDGQSRSKLLRRLHGLLYPTTADSQPTSAQALEAALLDGLLSLVDAGQVDAAMSRSFARRRRVVMRATEWALAQPSEQIRITDLCRQLHVSRRTLQYCFEDVLGSSPLQFLRALRLNAARRTLRTPSSQRATVSQVASDWGFGNLSQFSSDYRKLFGSSPSVHLRV